MRGRAEYGMVTAMIADIMALDERLTIEQLHILTGAKRDTIIKAVRRNQQLVKCRVSGVRRGARLVVGASPEVNMLNVWLLQGMVKHGSKTD